METVSSKKLTKLFDFGVSTVLLPYYGDLYDAANLMTSTFKKSRATWFNNLKPFVDFLPPSPLLKTKIEQDCFFESMNEDKFNWITSIPIVYFKFIVNLTGKSTKYVVSNMFENFNMYLEHLIVKQRGSSDQQKQLFCFNKQTILKINAENDLEGYMRIYESLKELGVSDDVLEVRFTKNEFNFKGPLY